MTEFNCLKSDGLRGGSIPVLEPNHKASLVASSVDSSLGLMDQEAGERLFVRLRLKIVWVLSF